MSTEDKLRLASTLCLSRALHLPPQVHPAIILTAECHTGHMIFHVALRDHVMPLWMVATLYTNAIAL